MSAGPTWPLDRAEAVARRIVAWLAPTCSRIEVAGSIRRRSPLVHDVEIVAEPIIATDLWGEPDVHGPHVLDSAIDRIDWLTPREPRRMGTRYKAMQALVGRAHEGAGSVPLREGVLPVDLFIVLPPAQWGAILAIRTGPRDYSTRLVTQCQRRGLRCSEGRLVDHGGHTVPTPDEADFLANCGERWTKPEDRR